MYLKHSILFIVILFLGKMVFAQRTETAINFDSKKSHITIEVENDMLFQSDQYYTAGIALTYTNKNLRKTPAQLILKSKDSSNFSFSGFGLEDRMFTPFSITHPYAIENDRPYAAYILLSNFSVLMIPKKNLVFSNEIGIGAIGPMVGGEELQTIVHSLIGDDLPIGWENQVNNAFLLDYQFRVEKGFFTPWIANHFIPFATARIGTLKDGIELGLMIKIGNKNAVIASNKEIDKEKDHFIWEFVIEGRLQGVFYDATLQGGLMNGDELVTLNMQETFLRQYHIRTGVNIYYKSFYFRYMVQMNSSSFAAGIAHRYGGINIGFAF